MATIQSINELLNDKLYQVIGSTPASIAESLKKINLRGETQAGAQMFAVAIFAAAVNKATLETFVADSRFAQVRPLITASLSIQGKSNMTALTLLGHCFLTTSAASEVVFASEFRKKMGQDHLWAGELDSGSLSDLQRKILKEKKRITVADEARALGSGFLKHVGLTSGQLTGLEIDYFGSGSNSNNIVSQRSTGTSQLNSGTLASGVNSRQARASSSISISPPAVPITSTDASIGRASTAIESPSPPRARSVQQSSTTPVTLSNQQTVDVPSDIVNYRLNIIGQSRTDMEESIARRGLQGFIDATRSMMSRDPDGTKTRTAGSVAGN